MMTLEERYRAWWEKVGPKDCHEVQREEMRRAFYAGAMSLRWCFEETPDEPAAERAAAEALIAELDQWAAEFHTKQ